MKYILAFFLLLFGSVAQATPLPPEPYMNFKIGEDGNILPAVNNLAVLLGIKIQAQDLTFVGDDSPWVVGDVPRPCYYLQLSVQGSPNWCFTMTGCGETPEAAFWDLYCKHRGDRLWQSR